MACTRQQYIPCEGDLVFVGSGNTDFSDAISEATGDFVHVAIVTYNEGIPCVIEVTSDKGVVYTLWDTFLSRVPQKDDVPMIVIKRLKVSSPIPSSILRAKQHIGEPYDWYFAPNNKRMYCSELVYESFLWNDSTHIFSMQPMNFRNNDSTLSPFWITLYDSLGVSIPEGLLGTNPTDLSRDTSLTEVYRSF